MTRRYSSTIGVEYRPIVTGRHSTPQEGPRNRGRSRAAMAAVEPTESWSDMAINHWLDDQVESLEMEVATETAVMDWDDASEGTPPPPFVDEEELPTVDGDAEEMPELPRDVQRIILRHHILDFIERRLGTFELARCKLPEYFDQVRTLKRCLIINNPSPLDPEFDPDFEPHGMQIKQLEARLMTCKDHYWNQNTWWEEFTAAAVHSGYWLYCHEDCQNITDHENKFRDQFVHGWLWNEKEAWEREPGTQFYHNIWNQDRIVYALPKRLIELGNTYRALRTGRYFRTHRHSHEDALSETHIEAEIRTRLEREKTLRSPIFDVVNASSVDRATREYLTDDVCEKLWSSIRDARLWHETLLAHPHLAQFILPSAKTLQNGPTVSGPYTRAMEMLFYHVKQYGEAHVRIWNSNLDETTIYEWEYIIKLLLRTIITTGVVESYSTTYSPRVRDVSLRMTARQKLHLLANETCHGHGCDKQTGWDDVYLEWGTRLCPDCYKKKFIRLDRSEPLLQKYYQYQPQALLDRFRGGKCISLKVWRNIRLPNKQTLNIVDRTGGVLRADVEALDNEYQSEQQGGELVQRWAAQQEKYDMMVDALGLPPLECERSETFTKLLNSRKASLSRKTLIHDYRSKILRELAAFRPFDETRDMMVKELDRPLDVCKRSALFTRCMNRKRKHPLSVDSFRKYHKAKIVTELGLL